MFLVDDLLANLDPEFSPRRWGCFLFCNHVFKRRSVFPTQVGMFLATLPIVDLSSLVFPTQVGMFLTAVTESTFTVGFPHAGGDVSKTARCTCPRTRFSPRRWGCFHRERCRNGRNGVFPTQVGMFLRREIAFFRKEGFPHAGGDVSGLRRLRDPADWFSPRRWGCFPASIRMMLCIKSFPHAGGDVSGNAPVRVRLLQFSPRRWGCFQWLLVYCSRIVVFPTQVGMFLRTFMPPSGVCRFPHAGGDVSESEMRGCCWQLSCNC